MRLGHARGSVSAALGGRRNVLDRGLRDLRELVGLERAHVLVRAVMGEMLVVMAAHFGIGVQHAGLRLCSGLRLCLFALGLLALGLFALGLFALDGRRLRGLGWASAQPHGVHKNSLKLG